MPNPIPADRWQTVEALFTAASDLPEEEQEPYVVSRTGGDTDLRDEVLSLLRNARLGDETLLDAVRAGTTEVLDSGGPSPVGRMFGSWRVERELARGGMAVVYLGGRADGQFRKQVAIKLIKRGMDTDAVIARMRRERRILASLDHPAISRLVDGGTTEDGLPWIAMEFVDGLPVDAWCRQHKLTIEQCCELMAKICDAVDYAHRNLVVHGDIKPSNIMVSADGTPRLLDFGIAKLLRSEEDAGETAAGMPLTRGPMRPLTPEYASPEQLAGGAVGTASDVYSAGAVLYELLTGVRLKPDADLSGAGKASVAARAAGKGPQWANRLRGDLDTILQMAVRKDPERRYLSANQFAADLRRYLGGLPVSARKETFFYQLDKFVKRNRIAVATAVSLALLAAFGAGMYVRQARIAAQRFEDLRKFANSFLYGVDDQLRAMPDSVRARKLVAETALSYLNGLAAEQNSDASLRREAGNAWRRLGDLQGGATMSSLGQTEAARKSYQRSIALLEPLAREERGPHKAGDARDDLVLSLMELADLEVNQGTAKELERLTNLALPFARDTGTPPDPALRAQLGWVLIASANVFAEQGKRADALRVGKEAMAELEQAMVQRPEFRARLVYALTVVSFAELGSRDFRSALEHRKRKLDLEQQMADEAPQDRSAQRSLMIGWAHLGDVYGADEKENPFLDPKERLKCYQQMVAVGRKLADSDRTDGTAQRDLSIALQRLAVGYQGNHQTPLAVATLRESTTRLESLKKSNEGDRSVDGNLAYGLWRLGQDEVELHHLAEGTAALERAIAFYDELVRRDTREEDRRILLYAETDLANAYADSGKPVEARKMLARIEEQAPGYAASGTSAPQRARLPASWFDIAKVLEKLRDPKTAKVWYQRSIEEWKKLEPLSPAQTQQLETARTRLAVLSR